MEPSLSNSGSPPFFLASSCPTAVARDRALGCPNCECKAAHPSISADRLWCCESRTGEHSRLSSCQQGAPGTTLVTSELPLTFPKRPYLYAPPMRKLRPKEAKQSARGCTQRKQRAAVNPAGLTEASAGWFIESVFVIAPPTGDV